MTTKSFSLIGALLLGACGDVVSSAPDAGTLTDPIDGTWTFILGTAAAPEVTCSATIADGTYEVYCPTGSVSTYAPNCVQTKNGDLRMTGTWGASFSGTWDTIDRYEGAGCATAPVPVVAGMDLVTEDFIAMDATVTPLAVPETGFLEQAFGDWAWAAYEVATPTDRLECNVAIERGNDNMAQFLVQCPDLTPSTVGTDCTETSVMVLEGSIGQAMTGEVRSELRYSGAGCPAAGFPNPVVQSGTPVPMSANR